MRRIGRPDKEYILFCDESEISGRYYSNFYGGVIVGSSQYDRIVARLNKVKTDLHLTGEVKWSKVGEAYLTKYQTLISTFFEEVEKGHLKVRIMFRQNTCDARDLTNDQLQGTYFRLYYQFIKHAFGFREAPRSTSPISLRFYFDEFPDTKEASAQFKGFIGGLQKEAKIRAAGFSIGMENIAEVRSHDHVLAQCLDVVLGAMAFRLNDKHKEKLPNSRYRGKRTVAKEKLYKHILGAIRKLHPNFNVGISTGMPIAERWSRPYAHWRFVPRDVDYHPERRKP